MNIQTGDKVSVRLVFGTSAKCAKKGALPLTIWVNGLVMGVEPDGYRVRLDDGNEYSVHAGDIKPYVFGLDWEQANG